MTITDILELKDLTLIEPLFSDLLYQEIDELLLGKEAKTGKILVDEEEKPVLFSKREEDGTWKGCCTLFREPTLPLIEFFEQFEWEMYQENREIIQDAVREYYSTNLRNTVLPGPDDLNPSRARSIDFLIRKIIGSGSEVTCLDCCCGTGVGSIVMRQHAMNPLAYDNDDSLLVRGMMEGRLEPGRTMWIDGRLINEFVKKPVFLACGFMIGEIHSFNAHIWHDIITAACNASERVLFTTGTEPEINQIKDWVSTCGKRVEIFESVSDPIYDRWVCYSD